MTEVMLVEGKQGWKKGQKWGIPNFQDTPESKNPLKTETELCNPLQLVTVCIENTPRPENISSRRLCTPSVIKSSSYGEQRLATRSDEIPLQITASGPTLLSNDVYHADNKLP